MACPSGITQLSLQQDLDDSGVRNVNFADSSVESIYAQENTVFRSILIHKR